MQNNLNPKKNQRKYSITSVSNTHDTSAENPEHNNRNINNNSVSGKLIMVFILFSLSTGAFLFAQSMLWKTKSKFSTNIIFVWRYLDDTLTSLFFCYSLAKHQT